MKKLYQSGFSVVEGLLILVLIGLIGGTGFYVYKAGKTKENSSKQAANVQPAAPATPAEAVNETPTNLPFSEKLGISMDILPGWEVKGTTEQLDGATFYEWNVEKPGADGKIVLSSGGFRGGFHQCDENSSLSSATIHEVAPTKRNDLMFVAWSYEYGGIQSRAGIVKADEQAFTTTKDVKAPYVMNRDLKAGDYFYCMSMPSAGFSLGLNQEPAGSSSSRKDSIRAVQTIDLLSYDELSTRAQSYADIKKMLTSIR